MHSHILPAFDDGAKTVDDSLELIGHLRKQGVKNICLTPHFYTNELSYDDYLVEREEAFRAFASTIPICPASPTATRRISSRSFRMARAFPKRRCGGFIS